MKKAIFLDRDGTINIDYGYVHSKEAFQLIEGAEEALLRLQELGYALIIISNQSGIGRGYFSEEEYLVFQEYVIKSLNDKGIRITASYYCPHTCDDNCSCRKPKTGLFEIAAREFDIDWNKSIAIGDRYRDLTICKNRGVEGYFIRGTEAEMNVEHITSVNSLLDAATVIMEKNNKGACQGVSERRNG